MGERILITGAAGGSRDDGVRTCAPRWARNCSWWIATRPSRSRSSPASAPHRAEALVCDVICRAEVARIAAANDPVDALVLAAGDLPLDDWRELASDEVIALNLHGPIHFARAYLPAGHDGAPAWRMVLVRSLAGRIGGLIASPAASPRRSAPGPCARPN